uniref:Nuclear pore protein n=1 Tax=Physcomitrium patens TaxID=3218 RepID=A0A7I4E781_PHYPA
MAGRDTDMRSWADLLHNSSQLLHSYTPSAPLPPIQRSLEQLETLSRQLKARTSRYEAPNEAIAATRLLAREGISADQLTRDLKSFELKTSFEDVFPVEATSVEEYLQQVHEMAMVSAIQEAQRDNLRSFDSYMLKVLEDDWMKEKREFLNNLSRLPQAPSNVGQSAITNAIQPYQGSTAITPRRLQDTPRGQENVSAQQNVVSKKAAAYANVVMRLNEARERSLPFKVATTMKSAYESTAWETTTSKSVTLTKIWHLMQSILSEDIDMPSNVSKKACMVAGSRRHLEAGHEKYILDTIHNHPAQAALGGSTGNLQRVRAFLRVRLQDQGSVLDFDASDLQRQPPLDTTWHQIYYCLRSGYYDEALLVAQQSRLSRTFAPQLSEWISKGGSVSPNTAAAILEECERMARSGDRAGRGGYDKKKMLLYTIVCGNRQQADHLLRDMPSLFSTIEDFLWFRLALIGTSSESSSQGRPSADGSTSYTLEELQGYLTKFQPSHYTKNAADYGCFSEGNNGVKKLGSMDAASEVASIIRHYALAYVRQGNMPLALEYYAQAAATVGGGAVAWSGHGNSDQQRQHHLLLKQLMSELLLRDGGIPLLLGGRGSGAEGSLRRFIPDPQSQRNLLMEAARQCQESGFHDKAVELLKRIGEFATALEIVNQCLSDTIAAMASGRGDGDTKSSGLIHAGNEILEGFKVVGGSSLPNSEQVAAQQTAFRQLESLLTFYRFTRSGRYSDALMELAKLNFLPLGTRTPESSAEALRYTSLHVQACVPDLLREALTCLDQVNDADGTVRRLKSKIANFIANSLPRNLPQELYDRVAQIL